MKTQIVGKMNKVDIVSNLLAMDCEEALVAIFLSLDGASLDACSKVCKPWREFLEKRFWRSNKLRPALQAKLRWQWRMAKPLVTTKQIKDNAVAVDVECDDELALVAMDDGRVKVVPIKKLTRDWEISRDEEDSLTLFELDCRDQHRSKQDVQLCLGSEVIVTIGNGPGLVKCWNRWTGSLEYKEAHHAGGQFAQVSAVTTIGSGLVATGADGGEVVVLRKNEDKSPIWSVQSRLEIEDGGGITRVNHMFTDPGCKQTAIATNNAISLWDLEHAHYVEGSQIIPENPKILIYIQPHVFVLDNGIKVWNMMTGEPIKHVHFNIRDAQIGTNGSELFFSAYNRSEGCFERIFVFEASELVNPEVQTKDVKWREFSSLEKAGKVAAAINHTGIISIFASSEREKESKEQSTTTLISHSDFWRAQGATREDSRNSLEKRESAKARNIIGITVLAAQLMGKEAKIFEGAKNVFQQQIFI